MKAECISSSKAQTTFVRFTVAGAAQVKKRGACRQHLHGFAFLLLPVELRYVNHTASTNGVHFRGRNFLQPYNRGAMAEPNPIEQLVERVERLLLRYDELLRTNELLGQQVEVLTLERDSLKSRLGAARARVDALIERLPEAAAQTSTVNPAVKRASS
jgi:hypothetical protein